MDSTTSTESKKEISLLDSLSGEWLKLPTKIMSDVGPATQTFAGVLMITNRETYVSVKAIAKRARLPIGTVRKHLVTLHDHGWIENFGRGHTRSGRARRTCTFKVTSKAKAALCDYGILPWWACRYGRLQWSGKAVLSVVLARLAAMKRAVEEQGWDESLGEELFAEFLETLGGEDRFRFSLENLQRQTGLWSQAIVMGKRRLKKLGIVDWVRSTRDDGGDDQDIIFPNAAFRVVVTPTTDDLVSLTFKVVG